MTQPKCIKNHEFNPGALSTSISSGPLGDLLSGGSAAPLSAELSVSVCGGGTSVVESMRATVLCPLGPAPCVVVDPEVIMPTPMPNFRPPLPSFPLERLVLSRSWCRAWLRRPPSPSSSESESSPSGCRRESRRR